ncbi:MAG: aminopeptidase N [gamma proteobacterium symbiont of Stewartia floridana]|nr:aminopeptidase N [Candidatus Thiodiazotropha taylori]RLW54198.1 MAG: aminopeptidase N [gamma proteobacterium symbiont of Stewartia floridana]MCG7905668.1 aminopeptidase N [Candidatus Thiodiazotropha taylori]MCG7934092.1 aminopeptidase N [Candidatus Thiodiazotropha taylori]MCG7970113.1 aminopeptidase N [Candidatus Thiodiazotropha taylori]
MRTDNAKSIYLKDYQPPHFLVDQVSLEFDLQQDRTLVTSRLQMRRNPASTEQNPELVLDGEKLKLLQLAIDDQELDETSYQLDDHGLTIADVKQRFTLSTQVEIRPQENTALEGLYQSGKMYCTQCEAEGFRRITYFPDRPDVMASFDTTIIADKAAYPVLLSNGNCVQQQDLPEGRHQVRWEDPFPKPCYLFALVAGDLRFQQDSYTTGSGREVDLRIYVEPENIDKCDHAMVSLKHAMAWDEERYGREYDLDIFMIVAVNDFNMGAMENKGLNIFNSKFVLARPDTATDSDFQHIEGVIAHEYFHNWTGNRITCRDWFQLSLKEGLTVFRDQEFSADMGSRGVKRIEDVRLLRSHQFAEDAGPMAHPVRPESYIEINNFYTVTVYEKGAEVVRMQANLLGAETYRKATDLYFERHDGEAVTTDDFVKCMEDASARDLSQFRLWYSQSGTPQVRVSTDYDEQQGRLQITFSQTTPETPGQKQKKPFHIPIALALLDSQGESLPLNSRAGATGSFKEQVLELTEATQTFVFHDLPQQPVPSILRGFSAPVKLEYDYSDDQLMFLMAKESDDFNRWDAAQTLARRTLLKLVEACQQGQSLALPGGFVEAYRLALTDQQADKALLSELLSLPSESTIGDQMTQVDVEAIHQARQWLKQALAEALRDDFSAVYERNQSQAYEITSASIGQRRLKNLALSYLMSLEDTQIDRICMAQFETADNMTDVMAALDGLVNRDIPERDRALSDFEAKWQQDPLVMDKWFAVQAGSNLPGTLASVKALMEHPAFSIRNPNKVRSLIGAFCSTNLFAFHAADGSGYEFLTDQVITLDSLNPQIAARLLRIMSRWRRYDESRQQLMRKAFERVLAQADISKDVFEIASKSVADE